jgi:hypothetical protein
MSRKIISYVSLPPATISSIPIYDYAEANEELASKVMEVYYECCGKGICGGCIYSFSKSVNIEKCSFCKAVRKNSATDEEHIEKVLMRVDANDAAIAGHEVARFNIGSIVGNSGNMERAVKHWTIAATGGQYHAMYHLITVFKQGFVSRESINSILTSDNKCCSEMRSKAGEHIPI